VRTDPRELLEVPGFFERRIRDWREHVRAYLDDPRPWHLVRYESLCGGAKRETIARLARHLQIELDDARLDEILSATTVAACRESAPGHVHSGSSGRAPALFSSERLQRFEDLACGELAALGYPLRFLGRLSPSARRA
jgi:hypothetical protein